jgi:hypothetical protein
MLVRSCWRKGLGQPPFVAHRVLGRDHHVSNQTSFTSLAVDG